MVVGTARRGLRMTIALLLGIGAVAGHALRQEGPAAHEPAPSSPSPAPSNKVADFELRDAFGTMYSLADLRAKHRLVAVVFWGCDCPLVRLYAKTLNDLAKKWATQGVALVAINSNVQDSPTAMTRFIETEGVDFPILKDPGNRVADLLHAERTPEAVLISADGAIVYRGRIDDQFGIGYRRDSAREHFLNDAVQAALLNRPIKVPRTEPVGCLIGRSTKPAPRGGVTYSEQVARIFQQRCEECHRDGEVAPFPLTTYEQAYGWAEMIGEVIEQERMPPWFADGPIGQFSNDHRLLPEEKELVLRWIADGCPEGDRSKLPSPRRYTAGWSISPPDAVLSIGERPVKVPARGPWEYQTFFIPTSFAEDRWIKEAEARPGNRKVVHHIAVWILREGMDRNDYSTSPCISFAPGMPSLAYPEGAALLLPKGATIRYQIHYEPCGYETEDLSTLGLVFAPPEQVRSQVMIDAIFPNDPIQIPPNDKAYRLVGHHTFARDAILFGLMPHMHVRGRSFRYVLSQPDGTEEVLLDLPRWDFGWQFWYLLPKPRLVQRGSKLRSESIFDNSSENLSNPDPTQRVQWGPKTTDEMTVGVFAAVDPLSMEKGGIGYYPPLEGFAAPVVNGWSLRQADGSSARLINGSHPYARQRIEIQQSQGRPGDIQALRPTTPMQKGHSYCLQFRVRSSAPRMIDFAVRSGGPPGEPLGLNQTLQLGTEPIHIRHEFYATADALQPEIQFDLGSQTGEVELENVVLLQGFHR